MTSEQESAFSGQWWEQHYRGSRSSTDGSSGQPSAQLVAELAAMAPGVALEAGCGTGADAAWLARQGWDVTAVDISSTAVQRARALAAEQYPRGPGRVSWLVADLTSWRPPRQYDLVVSLYVHPEQPFGDFVGCLASAVAPGGTLLVVGHHHDDDHSAAHAPAAASVETGSIVRALDPREWEVVVAEARTRQAPTSAVTHGTEPHIPSPRTMFDVVVRARRLTAR